MMATPPPQSDLPDAPVDTGDVPAAEAIALPDDSAPAGLPDSATVPDDRPLRRILVALDASPYSHAALEAAVTLAMRLRSEIQAVFVEDINLLRLAELPFAREVRFGQAGAHQVRGEDVQRGLRARAAVLRRHVEEVAEQSKVSSTFRVVRGAVAGELLAAALEADLLAMGRLGHSVARHARLGSTARAAIARAVSPVLLVHPTMENGPMLVLYDGSPAGARALELAAHIAGDEGEFRVLIWGPDEAMAADRRQAAEALLQGSTASAQYQQLDGGDAQRILAWVNKQHGSLLILASAAGDWPDDTLETLLEDANPQLLFIR